MTDIVERLAKVTSLKVGDPIPDELGGNNNWGPSLSALCADAIAEIMALRTTIALFRNIVGVATGDGPSFAQIKALTDKELAARVAELERDIGK